MCLAIPMQIVAVDGTVARCARRGVARDVDLFLLQDAPPAVGDYVMVHVGYAIQRIDPEQALASWAAHDDMTGGADA